MTEPTNPSSCSISSLTELLQSLCSMLNGTKSGEYDGPLGVVQLGSGSDCNR